LFTWLNGGNLIWFPVFYLTGDEKQVLKTVHKPEVQVPLNLEVEGPWGGLGGVPFNDGLATGIKGFKIKTNAKVLFSLSVEYDKRGKSFHSHHHGNPSSDRAKKLQEDEVSLICIL